MSRDARCQGTADQLQLAVGVMSRPLNGLQRAAVRRGWGHVDPSVIACFIVGVIVKRTPVSPWAPEHKRQADLTRYEGMASPPRGEFIPLAELPALETERSRFGDVLLLNGSAEIDSGGTSGLKTLTWWQHAMEKLPNVRWLGKADDDTLVNVPQVLARLPETPSPLALFGSVK